MAANRDKKIEFKTIHPNKGDAIVMIVPTDQYGRLYFDALTLQQQFGDLIEAFPNHQVCYVVGKTGLESLPVVNWIRKEDEMPESAKDVFMCLSDGTIGEGQWNERWGVWMMYKGLQYIPDNEVVAWFDLPLPLSDEGMQSQ